MKKWTDAEIKVLNIDRTENQPSAEIAVDDLINGVFTFGKRESSGISHQIVYTPTE